MSSNPLPDSDHVSRYCKPSSVGKNGLPAVSAFRPQKDENYLSVNWLEYFGTLDLSAAVQVVRMAFDSKGYRIRPNGRFAVLNVMDIKDVAYASADRSLKVDHLPLADDKSHAGILGYTVNDFEIAAEIKALVGQIDIHPAVP